MTTSFSVNLWYGNIPPGPLTSVPPERSRVYERLGLDEYTRTVIEYAFQRPAAFLANIGGKALFSIGFFEWSGMPGGGGVSWLYVAMWPLTLAAVIRLRRRNVHDRSPAVWLPLAGALSHLTVVVIIIYPFGYNDRLILPLYPLLVPYAAIALEPLVRPEALAALRSFLDRLMSSATGWARRHPRRWLYLGFSAAILQRFIW